MALLARVWPGPKLSGRGVGLGGAGIDLEESAGGRVDDRDVERHGGGARRDAAQVGDLDVPRRARSERVAVARVVDPARRHGLEAVAAVSR